MREMAAAVDEDLAGNLRFCDSLDLVFASEAIADRVSTAARIGLDEWGPSDHLQIEITVAI